MLLLATLFFINFSFVQDDDKVTWNKSNKLTWDNFHGAIPFGNPRDAVSSCSVYAKIDIDSNYYIINKHTYFRQSKSWAKNNHHNDYLLNHEQRHFDITEIHSRIFVKKFENKKIKTSAEAHNYFDELTIEVGDELSEMHEEYDKEANHSRNKPMQKKWDIKIDSMLTSLDKYEGKTFHIPRNKQ